MAILNYDPSISMAIASAPFFPEKDEALGFHDPVTPVEIDEGKRYYVKFYSGNPIPNFQNAPFCGEAFEGGIFELNFRGFVGLSRIENIKLFIRNKKITDKVYESMLDELAEHYSSLVFSFASPAGQHFARSGLGKNSAFVEYLFLKKYLLDQIPDIEAIANIFLYNPHRKFEREIQRCSIQDCQLADVAITHSILNSPMAILHQHHPLLATTLGITLRSKTGKYFYPVEAAREVKSQTVDTYENRFIKFFLQSLLSKLESIENVISIKKDSYFNPDIHHHLNELRKKLDHFLSHNIWKEVGLMRFIPASSLVLQRRDGYRQLFTLYSLLQLATQCDFLDIDFEQLIEIKDVPTLYEYWCFFQIKTVCDSLAQACKVSKIVNEFPLEHTLSEGLCIEYDNGAKLLFNKSYFGSNGIKILSDNDVSSYGTNTSYSHNLRPDIVIEQKGQKLIFDAKYKGKRSSFYCEEENGSIHTWKNEDLDKMHTYREAIKGVVGSFILFPGENSIIFPAHKCTKYFYGIGAFSLKPELNRKIDVSQLNKIKSVLSDFIETVPR